MVIDCRGSVFRLEWSWGPFNTSAIINALPSVLHFCFVRRNVGSKVPVYRNPVCSRNFVISTSAWILLELLAKASTSRWLLTWRKIKQRPNQSRKKSWERYYLNQEKHLEYARTYRDSNKERIREQKRARYHSNKEFELERQRVNRAARRQRAREDAAANEHAKQTKRKWYIKLLLWLGMQQLRTLLLQSKHTSGITSATP